VVSILIPITFIILSLLGVLLLIPAVQEIKMERAATLRLFLSVPKSSITAIVGKLRADDEQGVGEGKNIFDLITTKKISNIIQQT
jgi:hypothetical protein